jgi:hypothetical protein
MDGNFHVASIYDRAKLLAGNLVEGPAIITEMDSTTLVLADCQAEIDATGVILIRPRPDAASPTVPQPVAAGQGPAEVKVSRLAPLQLTPQAARSIYSSVVDTMSSRIARLTR